MNISSVSQMPDTTAASAADSSNQDSHEKSIHNQITSLQGKMRDLTYDTEMSADEKSDKKKELQEKIQDLNSELKKYRVEKRRTEAKKQQEKENSNDNAAKSSLDKDKTEKSEAGKAAAVSNKYTGADENSVNNAGQPYSGTQETDDNADNQNPGLSQNEAEVMVSIANTRKQFANMEKIQTNLTGLLRTAETDEEKLKIQKKIDSVSNIIGDEALSTADKLARLREDEQDKKDKIRELQKEREERKANMKAAVPKSGKSVFKDNADGKVLLTRKKS